MTIQANSFIFLMFNNLDYNPYTKNKSMLSNNFRFITSNFFLKDTNNNLHFDEFILKYQIISHKLTFYKTKDMSYIENLDINDDSNKFLSEHIPKQQ